MGLGDKVKGMFLKSDEELAEEKVAKTMPVVRASDDGVVNAVKRQFWKSDQEVAREKREKLEEHGHKADTQRAYKEAYRRAQIGATERYATERATRDAYNRFNRKSRAIHGAKSALSFLASDMGEYGGSGSPSGGFIMSGYGTGHSLGGVGLGGGIGQNGFDMSMFTQPAPQRKQQRPKQRKKHRSGDRVIIIRR